MRFLSSVFLMIAAWLTLYALHVAPPSFSPQWWFALVAMACANVGANLVIDDIVRRVNEK